MTKPQPAILSVHGYASKQLDKLEPAVQRKYLSFSAKMGEDVNQQGLKFQQLRTGSRLYSARVGNEYRAIMYQVAAHQYLLLTVLHRDKVYDRLDDRLSVQINKVSGAVEVIDLDEIDRRFEGDDRQPQRVSTRPRVDETPSLFAPFGEQVLRDLGVSPDLLPLVMKVISQDQLLALCEPFPTLTQDVLLGLSDGKSVDEVMEYVTRPVAADDVDTDDLATALVRTTTEVVSSDEAVRAMQAGTFAAWRVFLHPTQRKLVERTYTGPARVSGGPGTGKTVVAMHRTARLARELTGDRKILLTTYNTNLASYLRTHLSQLLPNEYMDRVDIVNIDKLVRRIALEDEPDLGSRLNEREAREWWNAVIAETGESEFDADFLHSEWTEIVCGQLLRGRADYFAARRAGRSRRVSRAQRSTIWKLVERFTARLRQENRWTFEELSARVAMAEEQRSSGGSFRYAHVLVDEAQDLTPGHWRLLRTLVAPGQDDLFIAGDTHQRIYGPALALGPMGINIRGRSTRLTLSYRTTRQILGTALGMISGETFDDLDDGTESLAGYRSVTQGAVPARIQTADLKAELDAIVAQLRAWSDVEPDMIAVCAPDSRQVKTILDRLENASIKAGEVTRDGPPKGEIVNVATLKRLKGMEYRCVIIAGIGAAQYPRPRVVAMETSDAGASAYRAALRRERCELFVAATRARDALTLIWSGTPSRFLVTD